MSSYVRGVLVQGVTAHVLAQVLALPDVERRLRNALPPLVQLELEATRRAFRQAALDYESQPIAVDGSAETEVPEVEAPLGHEITTGEAAVLLDLSERRVRQLAAEGGMGRLKGGRWVLDRTAVLAYAARRRAA
ncbi:helix-turn-helix domain-containing protein [Streptomyces scabiei]|uniref:helix-turn-helix domain-containing protein n=1 Tax=Streptomyces scabiei TaxID=1930 RepID=UPI0029AB8887|nr:helix-turn-helix domain-containing protein [Streptomyces scabiei]MDX3519277.1 helix-turn-helix domain-containing protein [Streptomyces scabiei]